MKGKKKILSNFMSFRGEMVRRERLLQTYQILVKHKIIFIFYIKHTSTVRVVGAAPPGSHK